MNGLSFRRNLFPYSLIVTFCVFCATAAMSSELEAPSSAIIGKWHQQKGNHIIEFGTNDVFQILSPVNGKMIVLLPWGEGVYTAVDSNRFELKVSHEPGFTVETKFGEARINSDRMDLNYPYIGTNTLFVRIK